MSISKVYNVFSQLKILFFQNTNVLSTDVLIFLNLPKLPCPFELIKYKENDQCVMYSNIAYLCLKNDVGPKNMRQTSLLVVLTYLFYIIIKLVLTVSFVHGQLERVW